MKKIFAIFMMAILGFYLVGCNTTGNGGGENPGGGTEQPEKPVIAIDETSISLKVGESYTFNVTIDILFETSSRSIVSVNENTKTITAVSAGQATITIYAATDTSVFKNLVVTVTSDETNTGGEEEITPTAIQIESKKTKMYLDDVLELSFKVTPENASTDVKWTTGQKTIINLSEDGVVTPLRAGTAKIKVVSTLDPTVSATIEIEIIDSIDPDKFFKNINFENPANQTIKVFGWAAGSSYEYNLLGSVTKYYFGDIKITVDYSPKATITQKRDPETGELYDEYSNGRSGELISSYRYVVVHDTAETRTNGTALGLGNWVETDDSSWHYAVDDKDIVQKIPLTEVAWHAGDGARVEDAYFIDTKITATSNESAKVTISTDGYFVLNGTKSKVKAPRITVDGNIVGGTKGIPTNEHIPYTGINNYVDPKTGTYWISNTWWSETYEHVGNYGGSTHSIGIEGCIVKGSDISLSWSRYAKLIGTVILPATGLTPADVRQHNTFSGKDCPMTMRHAKYWETFIEMVTAEYYINKYFKDYKIEFNCNSPYVGSNGLIKSLPTTNTEVQYSIKVTGPSNFNKTYSFKFTLASTPTRNVNESAPKYNA